MLTMLGNLPLFFFTSFGLVLKSGELFLSLRCLEFDR